MSEATPQALTPAPPVEVADELVTAGAPMHLALGLLEPDPEQPRKRFRPNHITELAGSIKSLGGVIHPILARPNPHYSEGNGRPPYQIVCGECRWRASGVAGMRGILTIVRDLSDFDVHQIQLIENFNRNDLHPLEEAEGLQRLLRAPGATEGYANAEELAHRFGKSRRWVYDRLCLLKLCDQVREALWNDELGATIAVRISTLAHAEDQVAAMKRAQVGFGGQPMSYRDAEEMIKRDFMLRLDRARFDIKAVYQVAGACGQCPKRSGSGPDLFEDTTGPDMCQDRLCFGAKTEEAHQQALQAARDAGSTVLAGDAARKLMHTATALPHGHHFFDQPCPTLTSDPRPLREIFGAKARDVLVLDLAGTVVSIVPDTAAKKLLKSKGLLRAETPKASITSAAASVSMADASPAAEPARKAAPVMPLMTEQQRKTALEELMDEGFSERLFMALHQRLTTAQELPLLPLRRMLSDLVDEEQISQEALCLMYKARGWPGPNEIDFERRIKNASGRELGELLIESLYARELAESLSLDDLRYGDDHSSAMAELYELDLNALNNEAFYAAEAAVDAEQAKRQAAIDAAHPADATQSFVAAHGKKPGQVKYRNSATGESWSGRGLQPKWLKAAIGEGAKLSDFEVTA